MYKEKYLSDSLFPSKDFKAFISQVYSILPTFSHSFFSQKVKFHQIKHAQFLHPEKRNQVGSTSDISNLAINIPKALGNRCTKLFYVDELLKAAEICDQI